VGKIPARTKKIVDWNRAKASSH